MDFSLDRVRLDGNAGVVARRICRQEAVSAVVGLLRERRPRVYGSEVTVAVFGDNPAGCSEARFCVFSGDGFLLLNSTVRLFP